jgi:ubiquinone/menaquinone biosynthesis C-methylase UbiE
MRVIALLLSLAAGVWGQAAKEANKDYQTPEQRTKVVDRLEAPDRLASLKPAELAAKLEILHGTTVVDLGTGTGNLLDALSHAVGGDGHVIAEDIHSDFLERARERAKTAGLTNVEFVLGTEVDPKLPAAAADVIVILDAYHHFDYPEKMLAAIKRGLRPGGRLAIVEYHKQEGAMGGDPSFAVSHIRAGADQVVKEVESAGYTLLWRRDYVPGSQYIAMFRMP